MQKKELFNNKYRTKSCRLQNCDYSQKGHYFVTICTNKFKTYFGYIKNEKMIYSKLGIIIKKTWMGIPNKFKFVKIDKYQIMPNHVHGIITICRDVINHVCCRDAINRISTDVGTTNNGGITNRYNPMGKNTLGEIIRWFKGRCTYEIKRKYPDTMFKWQSNYYDRIIRNRNELERIREYIINNPAQWEVNKN